MLKTIVSRKEAEKFESAEIEKSTFRSQEDVVDCNTTYKPGIDRFLEFYSRYSGIGCGVSHEVIVDRIMEKTPLVHDRDFFFCQRHITLAANSQ